MARIYRLHGAGGTEVMRIDDIPVAAPGRGEVRLSMQAIGVNRGDVLYRKGGYPGQPPLPSIFGFEGAGIVEALGEGVEDFAIGDAVSIIPLPTAHYGSCGELMTISASRVAHHPHAFSAPEAAALWSSYLTAYNGLIFDADLQPGEFFVMTAASSGVGIAAIEIAKQLGAIPIALTRGPSKVAQIRALGAPHIIVTDETPELERAIRGITGGKGVRVVFDAAGGPLVKPLTDAMCQGGVLVSYGMLSQEPVEFPLPNILIKGLTVRGSLVTQTATDAVKFAQARAYLATMAEAGYRPLVAEILPFEAMAEAHDLLESNFAFGKVVVSVAN